MGKIFAGICCTLFLFASCSSQSGKLGRAPESIEKVTFDNIRKNIVDGDIAEALQNISSAERGLILLSSSQILDLKQETDKKFNVIYDKALKNKDYFYAYKLKLTAENAGLKINNNAKPMEELVFSKSSLLSVGAKLFFARKYIDLKQLGNNRLSELCSLAFNEGDTGSLKYFLKELEKRKLEYDKDNYNKVLDNRYSNTQLINGTVTIWVNRGMKIEKGVGLPDRVIGSGFFIDKKGFIITNYHVIESEVDPEYEGYSRLYVRLSSKNNEKISAKVVGWDKTFDLALLKIPFEPETVFHFGDDRKYDPGTPVIVIGSPGGLENTMTSGIVSAYGRKFFQMGTAMQVDAPINHGNSGGPLVDKNNNLMGVVFAGIEQFEGVNFAIPSGYVKSILPLLYQGGKVVHSFMGISLDEHLSREGLTVLYVLPGDSADKAGIIKGDILTSVNGMDVRTIDEIQKIMLKMEPEVLVKISWIRDGKSINGLIKLSKRPDNPLENAYDTDATEKLFLPVFGMDVNSLSSSIFGKDYIITNIIEGSIADDAGLSVNDPFSVIKVRLDKKNNIFQLEMKIKKRKSGFLESGFMLGTYFVSSNFI